MKRLILAAFCSAALSFADCAEWHLTDGTTLQSCKLNISGFQFFTDTDLTGAFNPGRITVVDNTQTTEPQMQFAPAYRMGGSNPQEGTPNKPTEDDL